MGPARQGRLSGEKIMATTAIQVYTSSIFDLADRMSAERSNKRFSNDYTAGFRHSPG